jgi:hypothetical protein
MEGVVGNMPSGGHHEDVGEDDEGPTTMGMRTGMGTMTTDFFATINCAKRCRGGDAHGEDKAADCVRGEGGERR